MPGTLHVSADRATLARDAADLFLSASRSAIAERGRFSVALSGGSTPKDLYRLLAEAPYANTIEWSGVHLFWGDERYLPKDHPDSNFRMVHETLLEHIAIPPENVHPMPVSDPDPEAAARAYAQELRAYFGEAIRFDLVLLGLGGDGHTASLFPGDSTLTVTDRPVAVARPVSQPTIRLTLTYPVFNRSRLIVFLVAGQDKAEVLAEVMAGGHTYPSQAVLPEDGELFWYVERTAATLVA